MSLLEYGSEEGKFCSKLFELGYSHISVLETNQDKVKKIMERFPSVRIVSDMSDEYDILALGLSEPHPPRLDLTNKKFKTVILESLQEELLTYLFTYFNSWNMNYHNDVLIAFPGPVHPPVQQNFKDLSNFARMSTSLQEFRRSEFCKNMFDNLSYELSIKMLECLVHNSAPIDYAEVSQESQLGNPEGLYMYGVYGKDVLLPPSFLRYLWHSYLILRLLIVSKCTDNVSIIELGGGYGAQALCLFHIAERLGVSIKSYQIMNLSGVCELQNKFLKEWKLPAIASPIEDREYSSTIVISSYWFSELQRESQDYYYTRVLEKASQIFLVYNLPEIYPPLLKNVIREEVPQTGTINKFITKI